MFYVVSYDIPDDRRRGAVSKVLEGYGMRVQFSVFECHLSDEQLRDLRRRLQAILVVSEDSLRYYRLCRDCFAQVDAVGGVRVTEDPGYWVA